MIRTACLFLIAGLVCLAPAQADVVHLKSGAILRGDRCWEEEDEVRCRRAGGVIGVPRSEVLRIEAGAGPPAAGTLSGGRRPSRSNGRQAGKDAPGEPLSVTAPGVVVQATILGDNPEGWARRLEELEESIGRPGGDEESLRREAAILHTLLGNEAVRTGDPDLGESHYLRATDQDPHLSAPILNLGRIRLVQGRHDEAESLFLKALAENPDDPSALALLGDAAYRTGRLDDAIDSWERSLAGKENPALAERLEKAHREKVVEQDYFRSDAPHFTLKYDGDRASEELTGEILDHLESAYGDLTSRFIADPPSVIIVTLYSREAFHDITESPRWVGGLFDGQIRIPIGGLTRLSRKARNVFTHELAHCIIYYKTNGNAPKWIHEGIAQWAEGKSATRHSRTLARQHGGMDAAAIAGEFSYPLSLSLMEHFLETWSFSHLLDLLETLGRGSDLGAAFLQATGGTYEAFLDSWLREIRQYGTRT